MLLRLRWTHSPMQDRAGRPFSALSHAMRLRVGQVGEWPVALFDPNGPNGAPIDARVIATKLPAPLAVRAERRLAEASSKKSKTPDPRSLEAAHFVMVFTTLPRRCSRRRTCWSCIDFAGKSSWLSGVTSSS